MNVPRMFLTFADLGKRRNTCFTGTKVQFLTQKKRQADAFCSKIGIMIHENLHAQVLSLLALLVQKHKC
jgi:hypothetical protein